MNLSSIFVHCLSIFFFWEMFVKLLGVSFCLMLKLSLPNFLASLSRCNKAFDHCSGTLFQKMINGGTIDNWTCLNFSRMRPDEVQRFCMDLIHMCNATGMVSSLLSVCVLKSFQTVHCILKLTSNHPCRLSIHVHLLMSSLQLLTI